MTVFITDTEELLDFQSLAVVVLNSSVQMLLTMNRAYSCHFHNEQVASATAISSFVSFSNLVSPDKESFLTHGKL